MRSVNACSIVATVENGRVTKIGGDPDHPITRGFLCYRTNHFLDTQYSPSRLTQPLLRKNGALVPVSWDEALDFVAEGLRRIKDESGPAAIFHYTSGGTLGLLGRVSGRSSVGVVCFNWRTRDSISYTNRMFS